MAKEGKSEMDGPCLFMLVGIPGSGTSTLAALTTLPVVSTDSIREQINGSASDQSNMGDVFALAHAELESLLREGHDTIFDATNLTTRSRTPLMEIAQSVGARPVAVILETPVGVSFQRNEQRERVVPHHAMARMSGQFESSCAPAQLVLEGWHVQTPAEAFGAALEGSEAV